MKVQTWLANEIEFKAKNTYANPFEDVDIDVIFTSGKKKIVVPAFWDGGNTWRVRFALPKEGIWKYETKSNQNDKGFVKSGEITCEKYTGEYEIYKHGFVKTEPGKRYFVYDDGTPFFYLGDTHWNFICEEFDEPGDHAGDLKCESHFKYIVDKRVEQGFNVYQSEPIGAPYHVGNGVDEKDVEGFKKFDKYFKYIADKGLVHANAQLDFPKIVVTYERMDDKKYMRRLAKYWAARYAAYPVIWTLGQEVDNDFYFTRGDQKRFEKENNPFKLFAEGLVEGDPYRHPLTGHMEYTTTYSGAGCDGTCPSTSSFRDVKGHDFYGYQWSRSGASPIDTSALLDGWINGQGKVLILYESRYDFLWATHMGARSEGWLAYLNGLYGYGYGAIDIWLYRSTYDINKESNDGYGVVTPEDKQVYWSKSVEFETAQQMKYMKDFFQKIEWWKLQPRFNSYAYFKADKEDYYSIATDERNTIVMYFFQKDSFDTGYLTNLDRCKYTSQWFNPRTGEYLEKTEFVPDSHRMYRVPFKPDKLDWVLLVQKA